MRDFEQTALHQFLYFESREAAVSASAAAKRLGYELERLEFSPPARQWLVLLRDSALKEDAYAFDLLELADQFGGEYDGFERTLEEMDRSEFAN
jgi:hypothetical protein